MTVVDVDEAVMMMTDSEDEELSPLGAQVAPKSNNNNNHNNNRPSSNQQNEMEGVIITTNNNNNNNNIEEDVAVVLAPVHDVVAEFAVGTSVHGLPYVFDDVHYQLWKRILWLLLVLTCFGAMIWQIQGLIRQFRSYNVITTFETKVPTSLPFPQITVCDTNEVDYEKSQIYNITDPKNEYELIQVSQDIDELFLSASFNSRDLQPNITWIPVITTWGVCYTFINTEYNVYEPGLYGGLEFEVVLRQNDFEDDSDAAGLVIYIHQLGTYVSDQSPSIFVSPGKLNRITFNRLIFDRERNKPWSYCKLEAPAYTQDQCRSQCFFNFTKQNCNCRELGDWIRANDETLLFCDYDDPCLDEQYDNITNPEDILLYCDCIKPPCYEELYPAIISTLDVSEILQEQIEFDFDLPIGYFEQNYIRVQINYEAIREQILSETKEMTIFDLLSSIGGTMGLFAGISIISTFELAGELFAMRLLPRLWGDRRLYGLGSR